MAKTKARRRWCVYDSYTVEPGFESPTHLIFAAFILLAISAICWSVTVCHAEGGRRIVGYEEFDASALNTRGRSYYDAPNCSVSSMITSNLLPVYVKVS